MLPGQPGILQVLKKRFPEYMSYKEIQKQTETSRGSVLRCLKSLQKLNSVQLKTIEGKEVQTSWITLYRYREE